MLAGAPRDVCLRHLECDTVRLAPAALPEKLLVARESSLARDRLGIKPLYYAVSDGVLLFSSEVRSLLASGLLKPRLSPDSLEAYLTFGSVAEPSTLLEGVFSAPPGHCLTCSADAPTVKPSPRPYWVYSDAVLEHEKGPQPKNIQQAAKLLRPLLEEVVRDHLVAVVPLGVFLSRRGSVRFHAWSHSVAGFRAICTHLP